MKKNAAGAGRALAFDSFPGFDLSAAVVAYKPELSVDISLTRNYFELFGLSESFEIDQQALAEKYRSLQSALHPDRFVNKTDQERRVSAQSAAFVNEAYATLKSDLKRAHYLLKLKDVEFNPDTETSSDTEFLVRQMELHERIEEIDDTDESITALDDLAQELKQQQAQLISQFSGQYAEDDLTHAKDTALKLQFYERLNNQVRKKQEQYEEGRL